MTDKIIESPASGNTPAVQPDGQEPPSQNDGYPKDVMIECPACGWKQMAQVHFYVSDPFPTYFDLCHNCEYEIGESEWNEL